MGNPDEELTVAQRLGRALDRGLLPAGGPAEAAERLIERLERPARIALLGLPGSGKSSILNLLVGTVVVPETLRLPTIVVQHGDVARMVCTLADGTTKILAGSNLAEVLPLAPALVTLEMDLPALKVISLLEVSAGPMEAEQKRAATWASKRADIVIWCTTSYLPKEQAVWESLPDAVKDNSFMFLTKVDLLGSRDSAQAMHARVELRASEEFRQILSISAKQARAAMPPGGPVNRDLFRDSGASAVITAIKTRVQSGRRADTDMAELLLARHVEAAELVTKRFAEAEDSGAGRPWTPPPEPEETARPSAPEPVAAPPQVPVVEVEPPRPVDIPDEPEPEAAAEPEPEPEPEVAQEPDPVPDIVEPIVAAAPVVEPVVEAPPPEPEPEPTTRRRFADRIKRVASDADPNAAPAVPLRTTWKSKAETEAAPPPPAAEPEPAPRPAEATRRPRAAQSAKEVAPPPPEVPETVDAAPSPPEPEFVPPAEPELAEPELPEPEPVAPEPVALALEEPEPTVETPDPVPTELPRPVRERPARAITARPAPGAAPVLPVAAPTVPRPNLFGAKRAADAASANPLPDLSRLRATQEEMEAALAAEAEEAEVEADDIDLTEEEAPAAPSPASAAEDRAAEPARTPEPEAPARAADRPRLFDRARPITNAPAPAARPEPTPRATPISRSPAPPRSAAPPPPAPAAATAALDEAQFSPRAIMRRDVKVETAAPAPRRERPRIAPRAVPAAPAAAAVTVSAAEQDIVDEAVRLIMTRSAELAAEFDPEAKVPVDLILEHSRETSDQLMSVVSRGQSEALRRIGEDIGGVMDTIMLMQLEKGHAPADDALTLILQLKRELETLRAV